METLQSYNEQADMKVTVFLARDQAINNSLWVDMGKWIIRVSVKKN